MTTEIAELIFKADTSQLKAANQELKNLNTASPKVQTSLKRMASSFRVQSNAAQVASFQVQDFAVQVAGGQSAMRAFTQQAPQFLGVFGAGGAILGTIVAISSAVAGPLIESLFAAEDAADVLDESMKKLSDTFKITKDGTVLLSEEFAILANKSRDIAEVQLKARLITAAAATNAAFTQLSETVEDFDFYLSESGRSIRGNAITIANLAKEYGVTSKELMTLRDLQKTAFDTKSIADANALAQAITNISLAGGGTTDKFTELADATNQVVMQLNQQKDIADLARNSLANLDEQLATNSETAIKAAEEEAKLNAKRMVQREKDIAAIAKMEAELTEMLAAEDAQRASTTVRIEGDLMNQRLGFMSQLAGAIAANAKEGSALQKAAFAAQQAVAIATTILSTEAAATAALAPPPIGLGPLAGAPYAAGIRTIGYASAGLMAGLAIGNVAGGRAQGGQVRAGQSYRVGEYGPETLVMGNSGGSIIPTGAANDSGVTLITNVKIEGGTGNETVSNTKSTDDQGRIVQNIIVSMANDKTSGLMRGIFNNTTAQPRGNR